MNVVEHEMLLNDYERLNEWTRENLYPPLCDTLQFGTSRSFHNIHKNRYSDVLALEDTRVKIKPSALSGSDYINANHLTRSRFPAYIATQAPLPHTFNDFWKMIWEQKSPIIIMLTKLVERSIVKANLYWPQCEKEFRTDDFIISLMDELKITIGITVRVLRVIHEDSGESRIITQIQQSDWPDMGVPKCTEGILRLLGLQKKYRDAASTCGLDGPTVVHCSAGLGRSGTFIGIDWLVRSVFSSEMDPQVCLFQIVSEMRKQRRGMVQNVEQYLFIYRAFNDIINCVHRAQNKCSTL
eukprot:TRINITY_DN1700_c0_g1_i1.p1 TRINITY_DN1700_c0_g1~~TRINITY_DN1700_c0_g1_i1.p1  ORF type:complete len:297 (-),score=23.67 TRINITY_DN1700_c0_g1_i1:46-936(-)